MRIPEGKIGRVDFDPRGYYSDVYVVVCRWLDNAWYIFRSESVDFDLANVLEDVCMDEQTSIESWFEGVQITWLYDAPLDFCARAVRE